MRSQIQAAIVNASLALAVTLLGSSAAIASPTLQVLKPSSPNSARYQVDTGNAQFQLELALRTVVLNYSEGPFSPPLSLTTHRPGVDSDADGIPDLILPDDPSTPSVVDTLARSPGKGSRYGQCWVFSSLTSSLSRVGPPDPTLPAPYFGDADPATPGFQPFRLTGTGDHGIARISATIHYVDDFQGESLTLDLGLDLHLPGSPDLWQPAQVSSKLPDTSPNLQLDWTINPIPGSPSFTWDFEKPFIGLTLSVPEPTALSVLLPLNPLLRRPRR